jgi:hypothetical protein
MATDFRGTAKCPTRRGCMEDEGEGDPPLPTSPPKGGGDTLAGRSQDAQPARLSTSTPQNEDEGSSTCGDGLNGALSRISLLGPPQHFPPVLDLLRTNRGLNNYSPTARLCGQDLSVDSVDAPAAPCQQRRGSAGNLLQAMWVPAVCSYRRGCRSARARLSGRLHLGPWLETV